MPVGPSDPDALAGVSEALKEAYSPDRILFQILQQIQSEQRVTHGVVNELKEKMIRWEAVVNDVADLKKEITALKDEIKDLREEKQQRAGMKWLIEWTVRYIPWLAAAAASVWALKK